MQPQQPYQPSPYTQPQYSIDYLNQIAPKPHKPAPSWQRFVLPGAVIAVVLFILMWVFSLVHAGNAVTLSTVAIRLQSLQTVADKAQTNIKSNQLRVTNSNLSLYLINANRDIAGPLKASGVDPTKLTPSSSEQAADTALTNRLEDARLNAIYDRTYAREMDYQLTTLLIQMSQVRQASGSSATRQVLDTTITNLKSTQQQFASYDDSTN